MTAVGDVCVGDVCRETMSLRMSKSNSFGVYVCSSCKPNKALWSVCVSVRLCVTCLRVCVCLCLCVCVDWCACTSVIMFVYGSM